MATLTSASPLSQRRVKRLSDPARRRLAIGVALVAFGSFLPWLHTPVGNVLGSSGAGLWTFYAAMLGFGGVLLPVRLRKLAAAQAALLGLAGLGIVVWFLVGLISAVGFGGWLPGPGTVLVCGGAVLAGSASLTLFTVAAPEHHG